MRRLNPLYLQHKRKKMFLDCIAELRYIIAKDIEEVSWIIGYLERKAADCEYRKPPKGKSL